MATLLRDQSTPVEDVRSLSIEDEITGYFDELHDPLMRYLLSLRFGVQDAEDLIQETFFALFKHFRAGKPRTNVRGWVFRVAHNLGLRRQHKNRRTHLAANPFDHDARFQLYRGLNPEEELLNTQQRHHLLAVFQALPDRDRQFLALRAEGLRYREIADILSVSLGTVAAVLERSFKRLRTIEAR
jgi:RNA polymerase sigma-70 factor, ECF subfamily